MLDVQALRADTPATATLHHLNNAGCSLPPTPVLAAVVAHLELEARVGGYEAADLAAERRDQVYAELAALVGAGVHEIALTEGADQAWTAALGTIALRVGDRVLVDRASYISAGVALLQAQQERGVELHVVPDDEHGQVDIAALAAAVDERTKLVALTWMPTSNGLVNPVEAAGAVLRDSNAIYLLDGCQAIGQRVVDVTVIGCDYLSGTGRKFLRGPRGTGFLYAAQRTLERCRPPLAVNEAASWTSPTSYHLREDARRFEFAEHSVATQLGLGRAAAYANALGVETIQQHITALAAGLRGRLAEIPGVIVVDRGLELSGIVVFGIQGVEAARIREQLLAARVNTSLTRPENTRWETTPAGPNTWIRASVHYFNDATDLNSLVDIVTQCSAQVGSRT